VIYVDEKLSELSAGYSSDLWKYTEANGQWTWMAGPQTSNDAGTHGPRGIASTSYNPSSRAYHAMWADATDTLWLFGGKSTENPGGRQLFISQCSHNSVQRVHSILICGNMKKMNGHGWKVSQQVLRMQHTVVLVAPVVLSEYSHHRD
jgi:hypothetical protein